MRQRISVPEMIGRRFGRWTVLSRAVRDKGGDQLWLCRCECGTTRSVCQRHLLSGASTSCRCGPRGPAPKYGEHGARHIPEYVVWQDMRIRCRNPKDKGYAGYGGRGIKVCERWDNDFAAFLSDMRPRPSPRHSIERVDNDGNYEPNNCRWATTQEQAVNRRNNHLLRCGDVVGTLSEWAEVCGMGHTTILWRLRNGWSTIDAVLRPLVHQRDRRNARFHASETQAP